MGRSVNSQSTEYFPVSENALHSFIMMNAWHNTFVQTIEGTRVNFKVNYGLWVTMMYYVGPSIVTEG